jgi:hypothetical protein
MLLLRLFGFIDPPLQLPLIFVLRRTLDHGLTCRRLPCTEEEEEEAEADADAEYKIDVSLRVSFELDVVLLSCC